MYASTQLWACFWRTLRICERPFQSPPLNPLTIREGMPTERSISARRGGEVLAVPFLAVDEEVLDGVDGGVDDIELEGIAEPAGVAQVPFQRQRAGLRSSRASAGVSPWMRAYSAIASWAIVRSRSRRLSGRSRSRCLR